MTCSRFSLSKFSFLLATLLILSHIAGAQDFKKQVIYQIVTDRFFNGDDNDNPPQSAGLFDSTQTNWFAYWGGDLAGIQPKMAYIKGMGVTAIWISPTVDNENLNMNTGTPISAPYHGYDARDFMRMEEHFGDTSNSWTAFDNLVTAAHTNGIKVIVDWANNTPTTTAAENSARSITMAYSWPRTATIRTDISITIPASATSTTAISSSTTRSKSWRI